MSTEIDSSVNGKTQVYGVIGDPIEHTFSPTIQNSFAKINNSNIKYVPFHVKSGTVEKAINGAYALSIQGLNVTVPHKKEVIKHLCAIEKRAEQIGAVNTLKYTENGYVGYNTDILGILYSLKNKGISIANKHVLIIGAGGSACAASVLALSEGAATLTIANRTVANAEILKTSISKFYNIPINAVSIEDMYKADSYDIVIQTTTLGFGKNIGLSPISDKNFYKEKNVQVAFDVIYIPWETQFIKDAKEAGITAINGFDMLVYQAVAAQEIWLDTKYDEDTKERLKNKLAQTYGFDKK